MRENSNRQIKCRYQWLDRITDKGRNGYQMLDRHKHEKTDEWKDQLMNLMNKGGIIEDILGSA